MSEIKVTCIAMTCITG